MDYSTLINTALALALIVLVIRSTRVELREWLVDTVDITNDLTKKKTYSEARVALEYAWEELKEGARHIWSALRTIAFWFGLPIIVILMFLMIPFAAVYHAYFK